MSKPERVTPHQSITVKFVSKNSSGNSIRVRSLGGEYMNLPLSKIRNLDLIEHDFKPGYEIVVDLPDWLAKDRGLI